MKNSRAFSEQLRLLEAQGVVAKDKQACEDFLKRVSCNRIVAYLTPFRSEEESRLSIEFTRLKKIYEFDQELSLLVMSAIRDIEIYLKTQLAHYHGQKYGVVGYLDNSNYNAKHNSAAFMRHIEVCKRENNKSIGKKHNMGGFDAVPIWSIIDFFHMGMLSHFYMGMKNHDKADIAQELYGTNYQTLQNWLHCLTDLRNRCAHYARLYYWRFTTVPRVKKGDSYKSTKRLFAQIYMLKFMYPNSNEWEERFVKPLIKLVKKYNVYIDLKHMDFPYRWKHMLRRSSS